MAHPGPHRRGQRRPAPEVSQVGSPGHPPAVQERPPQGQSQEEGRGRRHRSARSAERGDQHRRLAGPGDRRPGPGCGRRSRLPGMAAGPGATRFRRSALAGDGPRDAGHGPPRAPGLARGSAYRAGRPVAGGLRSLPHQRHRDRARRARGSPPGTGVRLGPDRGARRSPRPGPGLGRPRPGAGHVRRGRLRRLPLRPGAGERDPEGAAIVEQPRTELQQRLGGAHAGAPGRLGPPEAWQPPGGRARGCARHHRPAAPGRIRFPHGRAGSPGDRDSRPVPDPSDGPSTGHDTDPRGAGAGQRHPGHAGGSPPRLDVDPTARPRSAT